MLLSAGDNIGASLFASAFNDDKPTIDVLNALDLDVTAVGNHEFDKGWPWYKSHVVDGGATAPDGTAYPQATFPSLGANVLDASGNPVLPASTQVNARRRQRLHHRRGHAGDPDPGEPRAASPA